MRRLPKLLTLFAASTLALSGCAAADPGQSASAPPLEKIVIAGLPMDENPDASVRYQLLMDLISEETGLPVEFYEAPDYAAIVEGLVSGRAHFAQLDGLSYVSAVNLSDQVELLTSYTRAKDQMPGLFGVGITRVESDIQSLQDLRGKTVCFPDPSSATGYLWPAYALQQVGIDADIVTSPDITPVISGTFPAVGVGVFNGDCDFGFIADVTWERILPTLGTVDLSQMRVVWESDRIPAGPFAANKIVPAELREQVKQLMIEKANKDYFVEAGLCEDVATCPHLAVSVWGFIETPDSFYDSVREVCNALELERCATKD